MFDNWCKFIRDDPKGHARKFEEWALSPAANIVIVWAESRSLRLLAVPLSCAHCEAKFDSNQKMYLNLF